MPTLPPPALHADATPAASAPVEVRGRIPFATVQLGAFASRAHAEEVLKGLRDRLPAAPDMPLRIRGARVEGRRWFRIMAGPFPADVAETLCRTLSSRGSGCLVRPEPALWREAIRAR